MVPFRINALFCWALVTGFTVYSGVWPTCIRFKREERLGKNNPTYESIQSHKVIEVFFLNIYIRIDEGYQFCS